MAFSFQIDPFLDNGRILYIWKHQKHLWFSSVFRSYRMETLARIGVRNLQKSVDKCFISKEVDIIFLSIL